MKEFFGNISEYAAVVWFVILAMLGGTANYTSKIKERGVTFSITEWLGELVISGFAGLMTYYICISLNVGTAMTAAACGICGHMGGRAIFLIEKKITDRVGLGK